jgi:hypothetical protein
MTFLIILGFVLFATLAVFGLIDMLRTIQRVDKLYQERLDQAYEEIEKEHRERLQYLAGIKTKAEVKTVPAKLGPEIVGELLADSQVEVLKELEEKKVSKQYTRR